MKKYTVILLALALSITSAFAQDAKSIYNKYSEQAKVEAVYISPAMFKLVGKIPDVEVQDDQKVNFSEAIKDLKAMYILSTETRKFSTGIKAEVEKMVASGKYEMIMQSKDDDGEIVKMFVRYSGDNISELLILSYEADECNFIDIEGNISPDNLSKLMK